MFPTQRGNKIWKPDITGLNSFRRQTLSGNSLCDSCQNNLLGWCPTSLSHLHHPKSAQGLMEMSSCDSKIDNSVWCQKSMLLLPSRVKKNNNNKKQWQMLHLFSLSFQLNILYEWACAVSDDVTEWTPSHTRCRCTVWCLCVSSCGSEAGWGTGKSFGTLHTYRDNRYTVASLWSQIENWNVKAVVQHFGKCTLLSCRELNDKVDNILVYVR